MKTNSKKNDVLVIGGHEPSGKEPALVVMVVVAVIMAVFNPETLQN